MCIHRLKSGLYIRFRDCEVQLVIVDTDQTEGPVIPLGPVVDIAPIPSIREPSEARVNSSRTILCTATEAAIDGPGVIGVTAEMKLPELCSFFRSRIRVGLRLKPVFADTVPSIEVVLEPRFRDGSSGLFWCTPDRDEGGNSG